MWQCGIDQWVGRNEFLYGKTKEERLTKKTQEVDSQIWHMHRADRKQVCPSDKHLFHMSAKQRITQSIDRKREWFECVTIAYEAWAALSDSQITSQRQLAPLWHQTSGQQSQVRLWPEY
jgi:acetyl-CoA carboxylase beta subunit